MQTQMNRDAIAQCRGGFRGNLSHLRTFPTQPAPANGTRMSVVSHLRTSPTQPAPANGTRMSVV